MAAGDWSLRNWRPVSALSTLLLVALCAFVGYWSDYTRIFPALGGPNAPLYDLTLKLSQSWRREIPTLSTVFVAIDEASLATPELAALPRALFQPVWARLIDGLIDAGAREIAFDVVFAYAGADFQVESFKLPDYDRTLIESLARSRDRIVLGTFPNLAPAPPSSKQSVEHASEFSTFQSSLMAGSAAPLRLLACRTDALPRALRRSALD